ncbi:MAG: hypothetical protein Q4B81_07680 [Moraxella sp.]|nr:hypothetical protein [Moraxella sp.]
MKKLALLALLAMMSPSALAANWFDTGVSSKENKEKIFVDLESVQGYYFNSYNKDKYYVMAWVKKEFPTVQKPGDGKGYQESKELIYVDCAAKKYAVGDVTVYTKGGAKMIWGGKNYVSTYSSDGWNRVVPDTVGDGIVQNICLAYQVLNTNS